MKDIIYREDAIRMVHEEFDDCLVWDESGKDTADEVEKILGRVPSAKHRTGKWIVWGGMDIPENHGRHKCSECREFALRWYDKPIVREHLSDFCPHCGADMRGEQDETE